MTVVKAVTTASLNLYRTDRHAGVGVYSVLMLAEFKPSLKYSSLLFNQVADRPQRPTPFCSLFMRKSEPPGFWPKLGYLAFSLASSAFTGFAFFSWESCRGKSKLT